MQSFYIYNLLFKYKVWCKSYRYFRRVGIEGDREEFSVIKNTNIFTYTDRIDMLQ